VTSALFWDIARRRVKVGPAGCCNASVMNCHHTLRNIPKNAGLNLTVRYRVRIGPAICPVLSSHPISED